MEWLTFAAFKAAILWLINVGLNGATYNFIMNNALFLAVVVVCTPWTWDNVILKKIKDTISNFKPKGEDKDV
jgi:hypothetical protein